MNGPLDLKTLIWVAARPPVPPFSGATAKTLCALEALASVLPIRVISFAPNAAQEAAVSSFHNYWNRSSLTVTLLNPGPSSSILQSAVTGHLQSAHPYRHSALPAELERLNWNDPNTIVVLDDILLAPLALRFGRNAILSPHDCMSSMFRRHGAHASWGATRLRLLCRAVLAERYERRYYDKAILVHVISHRDRVLLEDINPRAKYHVVPNDDRLNPGFNSEQPAKWDVMLWGSLDITTIASGARAFLCAMEQSSSWWSDRRVLLVGKVSREAAQRLIGIPLPPYVSYSEHLEDARGDLHAARITVIPDIHGAGMKNRCVNIVAAGRCLACLYTQMEGIEALCDVGAINATSIPALTQLIRNAIDTGAEKAIAVRAAAIFEERYNHRLIQTEWVRMLQRATALRAQRDIATGISS